MPGIVGVACSDPARAREFFDAASSRMLRHRGTRLREASGIAGRGVIGHVTFDQRPDSGLSPAAPVVFHGVLHNRAALANYVGVPPSSPVEGIVSALYGRESWQGLERLRGEFCLAVVDESRRQLLVATDPIGSYAIRWQAGQAGLSFSSDLSAVIKASPDSRRLNLRGVADYLTFGAILEDKTLVEGIAELDPGTVLSFDVESGTVRQHRYFTAESFFAPKASDRRDYLARLPVIFQDAVQRSLEGCDAPGLSLSGGLDSRAILSASGTRSRGLRTYTLGVAGCADEVIARRMAKIAGTTHTFFTLDDKYLRDFLPNMAEMVSITDGSYLSHGLTEMLAIRFLPETGIKLLLRGHGGELAKAHLAWPLHTDANVYKMTSVQELVPYLAGRANYVTPNLTFKSLFSTEAASAAGGGSVESFGRLLSQTQLSPPECCSFLYLRELHRRFTVPSLELFRTCAEVRLPFTDVDFLAALLGAPAEWRDSTEIHKRLTASGLPALNKVRNSNTGAPANAGAQFEFIADKANTILKRLNISGWRHYHNFDAWMRKMLLEAVESELLAPNARVQAFVPAATLRKLMQETREGLVDRGYLLQVLLILELWQRENGVAA